MRVESGQDHDESECRETIRQLIQHRAEATALVEHACEMSVHRVQQGTQRVQQSRSPGGIRHGLEREKGEDDARIADEVRVEEVHAVGGGRGSHLQRDKTRVTRFA